MNLITARRTKPAGFASRGLGRGTQVGILCRNHRGFVEASVAATKAGLVPVYLNTGTVAPQLAEVIERESIGALIGDAVLVADLAADAVPGPVTIGPEWDDVAKRGVDGLIFFGCLDCAGRDDVGHDGHSQGGPPHARSQGIGRWRCASRTGALPGR